LVAGSDSQAELSVSDPIGVIGFLGGGGYYSPDASGVVPAPLEV
jgi:hypothetical protein